MARSWEAKAPGETVSRSWRPELAIGDCIATSSASATGATVVGTCADSEEVFVTLSAGAAGTPATVDVTVTTRGGLTLTEAFILPILSEAQAFSYTARDVVYFALRKIVGNGNDPDSTEADDALERLNDMLATWRLEGCDVGLGKLALGDVLKVPDEFVSAIKFNLRVSCHDHYDAAITPYDAQMADMGKRLVKTAVFTPTALAMPRTLARPINDVADLF